ncbi:hypothetical protein CO662_30645 [Rhizobium anhuiense]|jgi:hypothetical protein|uniref:DUF2948 family protein n=1 Tax=Rhizobium anhuiense TaxID=1184720 RepID=A0ABX4IZE4_9HYPH|nr:MULTISPECIES: DUF2948 family protein [Rhizobium]MBB4216348.1 hypothetical protein [Rhizobium sp. BK212]MBB4254414.1 hypothetical protein [Rhizobium sp. BK008]PDS41065.1 hypothetical protein CO668_30400 [Rhizobium anhuiense]PDS48281.1 hypothetical protein CO662_30645 [Rhizobium anhuiense]PDS65402.1 hypothetical protein CO653_10680 [Rhizobium anhuiense]
MTDLKLVALDDEDLAVVSAHMQDSVFKVGDIDWSPRDAQFALAVNRFVWEGAERKRRGFERRRAALVFKRVLAVRSLGIDRGKRDEVLSLLALRFEPKGEGPDGTVELSLSGTASIALDVECIEVQMADIGGAWEASSKPRHR